MDLSNAKERFEELIRSELARIERMRADNTELDFKAMERIVVGIMPGDGIGPIIMEQAEVHILEDEAASRAYIEQMWAEAMEIYRLFLFHSTQNQTPIKDGSPNLHLTKDHCENNADGVVGHSHHYRNFFAFYFACQLCIGKTGLSKNFYYLFIFIIDTSQ